MSFTFRLQRVLELREEAEQAKARAFAEASDDADQARRRQDAIASLRTLQRQALDAAARGVITAGELQHLSFLVSALDDRLARASEDVREAERLVADTQAALQAASRDRRVLDRLKERHSERWQEAALQQDRLAMDEIALSQYTRRTPTPPETAAHHQDLA